MATARLTVVVDYDDAHMADQFIKKLEDEIGTSIEKVQEHLNFFPEGEGEEDSDDGIFVVSTLSDETALETE